MDTWTLLAHRLLQALPHTGENSGERPGSSPDVFLLRLPPAGTGNIIVQVIFTVAGAAVARHGHTSVVPEEQFTFSSRKRATKSSLPFHNDGSNVSNLLTVFDQKLQHVRVKPQLLAVEVHRLLVHLGLAVAGEVVGVLNREQVGAENDGEIGGSHLVDAGAAGYSVEVSQQERK